MKVDFCNWAYAVKVQYFHRNGAANAQLMPIQCPKLTRNRFKQHRNPYGSTVYAKILRPPISGGVYFVATRSDQCSTPPNPQDIENFAADVILELCPPAASGERRQSRFQSRFRHRWIVHESIRKNVAGRCRIPV